MGLSGGVCSVGLIVLISLPTFCQDGSDFLPLTVVETRRHYNADGAELPAYEVQTHAQRSDGAKYYRSKAYRLCNGEYELFRETGRIRDFRQSREVLIDYATESVTTRSLAYTANYPISRCREGLHESSNDRDEILGHTVYKTTAQIRSLPGRTNMVEMWVAPELDCYPLRQQWKRVFSDGSVDSSHTVEVNKIILGEPVPQFFTAPSGYVERPRSEVSRLFKRMRSDSDCDGWGDKAEGHRD